MKKLIYLILLVLILTPGCKTSLTQSGGPPGEEMYFMVPQDKIILDNGKKGYVDDDGILRGLSKKPVLAAGRRIDAVMEEIAEEVKFEKYRFVDLGPRYIEVRGAISHPGKYPIPIDEDWTMLNLMQRVHDFSRLGERQEYLLIRRSWKFRDAYMFLRGEALTQPEGIGGDDVLLLSHDTIIFPGENTLVYVFGSVKSPICFSFPTNDPPTLSKAIEKADGCLKTAHLQNIQVYRLFHGSPKVIYNFDLQQQKDFALQTWDVVYVPSQIPRVFVK